MLAALSCLAKVFSVILSGKAAVLDFAFWSKTAPLEDRPLGQLVQTTITNQDSMPACF
jgi:hypothetical protein